MTAYRFEDLVAHPPTLPGETVLRLNATDSITFSGGPASEASVIYGGDPAILSTVAIRFAGQTLVFDTTVEDISARHQLIFDGGSNLLIGTAGNDMLDGGQGGDGLFGGAGNDTLDGHDGANVLQGNQGDDVLVGGLGVDTMYGGAGNDRIVTGPAFAPADLLGDVVNGNLGNDTIQGGGGGDVLLGGQGNDSIVGGGGFNLLNGNLGDDYIVGGSQFDRLFGEAGDDSLSGGGAADLLSGGPGKDLFIIAAGPVDAKSSLSSITDWEAQDHIHFNDMAAPPVFRFVLNAAIVESSFDGARATAESLFASGEANIVAIGVGTDVVVFADTAPGFGAESAVVLVGRGLADIHADNFI